MATAQTPPFSVVLDSGMSTQEIQNKLATSTGTVYFKPGLYVLTGSLPIQSRGTYIGAGSPDPRFGSVLLQTATFTDPKTHQPVLDPMTHQPIPIPIFSVDAKSPGDLPQSVHIKGLTFDGIPSVNAKGIGIAPNGPAAANGFAELIIWTIRDNYFLTGLAEGIDIPMVLTRIEGNHFGVMGHYGVNPKHRHIHSLFSTAQDLVNMNSVVDNVFTNAKGSESVLFEAGIQLHIVGNKFLDNDADNTLQINGMVQVVIENNRFEGNRGKYIIHFARFQHTHKLGSANCCGNGNYIVRSQNNFYDMQRNAFIFTIDSNSDDQLKSGTQVFMGNESGIHFTHDGTAADLTDPMIADTCNSQTNAEVYLSIVGPFNIPDYRARNRNCCGPTETTLCN